MKGKLADGRFAKRCSKSLVQKHLCEKRKVKPLPYTFKKDAKTQSPLRSLKQTPLLEIAQMSDLKVKLPCRKLGLTVDLRKMRCPTHKCKLVIDKRTGKGLRGRCRKTTSGKKCTFCVSETAWSPMYNTTMSHKQFLADSISYSIGTPQICAPFYSGSDQKTIRNTYHSWDQVTAWGALQHNKDYVFSNGEVDMDGCITQISRSGEKENVYKGRLYGFHERATGKRAVIQMEDVTAPKRRPPRPENKAEFENALKRLGKGIMSYIYICLQWSF